MGKKKLEQYRGLLSPAEVADGMNAAHSNAQRLVADAELLLRENRPASSLALSILSIEESGKVSILRGLAVAQSENEVLPIWKEYRSHVAKNRLWPLIDLYLCGARKLDDFNELFKKDADHPFLLDMLKQIALYSDCLGNRHWSIPAEVVDGPLASHLLQVAKALAGKEVISQREIELWVQYSPTKQPTKELMEKAVSDWYAAMQSEGLKPTGENEMEQFIVDGFP
jgi:AbiV family abortive infection protein